MSEKPRKLTAEQINAAYETFLSVEAPEFAEAFSDFVSRLHPGAQQNMKESIAYDAESSITLQGFRAAWLSSRRQALEEAAAMAESYRSNDRAVNLTAQEIITGEVAESIAADIRREAEGK